MIATLEKDKTENFDSQRYGTRIIRRDTRPVMVGDIGIGGDNPVRVQSMINEDCLLYTSPSPRDATLSRMPSSA